MPETGWMGEKPDAGAALPGANFILGMRAAPGERPDPLTRARLAPDKPDADPADADEKAMNLLARGYSPGLLRSLSEQFGDVTAELEAEREKLERGKRMEAIAAREHAAGRIDVFRMQAMLDGDFGDAYRAEVLERRAESLRRQITEAQEMMTPPQARDLDPVEAASRHANQVFREVTRQRMAEAAQSRPAPRPFASVSRGGGESTEHTGPDCRVCAQGRRMKAAREHAEIQRSETAGDANPYQAQGYYDATDFVGGTESAILGLR